jgi:hypothetical protein
MSNQGKPTKDQFNEIIKIISDAAEGDKKISGKGRPRVVGVIVADNDLIKKFKDFITDEDSPVIVMKIGEIWNTEFNPEMDVLEEIHEEFKTGLEFMDEVKTY